MPRQELPPAYPYPYDRLAALEALISEAFSEGKVDFDKLRQALGNLIDEASERYTFSCAG